MQLHIAYAGITNQIFHIFLSTLFSVSVIIIIIFTFNRAKTNRSTNTMSYRDICLAGQLYI